MEFALALTAALLFALGTVLQQRAAMSEPADERSALGAGFLLRLARRPVWLAGIALDGIGFVAQAAALAVGRLAVVQPILATTVVFALPLGAWLSRQRIARRDLVAAFVVTAGLAAFLVFSDAEGGRDDAPAAEWLVVLGVSAALVGGLVGAARGRRPQLRAALLGTATGILWGVSAALTKATIDQLDEGLDALLLDWHLYALLVVGAASLSLAQAALQVGSLAPAIATQSIVDPLASVVIGVTLLQEDLHETTLGLVVAIAGLLACFGGLIVLSRSGIVQEQQSVAG